ncbi:MAG: hypothetical protein MUF13_17075 [Akkermansiaceae bacterium]|jgi:hypothetical protein|nr:hypothetical protein [Akkermansiaceae bacterium]
MASKTITHTLTAAFTHGGSFKGTILFPAFNFGDEPLGGGSFDNLGFTLIPKPSATHHGGLGMFCLLRRRR